MCDREIPPAHTALAGHTSHVLSSPCSSQYCSLTLSPRCPSALIARRTRQCCLSSSLPTPERVTVPPRLRPHEKKSCTSRSSCSGRLPSGSRPIFSLAVVMALCTGADASTPTSCLTKRSLWFRRAFWREWLCEAVKAGVRVVGLAAHGLLACCVAFP